MRVFFSLLATVLVTEVVAHADILPVTADQCSIQVNDVGFQYEKKYDLQTRQACYLGACDRSELGTSYLQLWVHPTIEVTYFTNITPKKNEQGINIQFYFERYLTGYWDNNRDEKTDVEINFVRDPQNPVWQAVSAEKNRDGKLVRSANFTVREIDGSITFQYQMRDNVAFAVSCKVPYKN